MCVRKKKEIEIKNKERMTQKKIKKYIYTEINKKGNKKKQLDRQIRKFKKIRN